jgi:nitrite reductase/ring-hydroxylating ferredoxin subunit
VQVRVAAITALACGEARKFEFEREGQRQEGFILRIATGFVAYHNRCPHWGVDLDMGEGRFYSGLTDRIFCSSHGALFVPSTGYCDAGPCAGDSLERFEIKMDGADAVLTIADVDPDPR